MTRSSSISSSTAGEYWRAEKGVDDDEEEKAPPILASKASVWVLFVAGRNDDVCAT